MPLLILPDRLSSFIPCKRNNIDCFAQSGPRNIDEMLVVREKQDLSFLTKLGKYLEAGCGASVIEVDQQIVRNERKRMRAAEIFIH